MQWYGGTADRAINGAERMQRPGLHENGAPKGDGYLTAPENVAGSASVLIGVINRPKDLEILYQQGWYRLPVRSAPRYLAAEYLALYQTRRCPPQGGAVNLLAPILRYSLVRRSELLPEEALHPRSHELYYRLELGPIWHLSHPVPALRQRRMAFITTTIGRLFEAQDLADLWQHTSRQERLQQVLGQQLPEDEGWLYEGRWRYQPKWPPDGGSRCPPAIHKPGLSGDITGFISLPGIGG